MSSLPGPMSARFEMEKDGGVQPGEPLPTGTVTLLLSDVEGSTRLWEAGEDTAASAIARHYELLDTAVSLHGGVRPVEQGEGDSVVAAFERASDAVAAALDVQRAFAEEPWRDGSTVRVRIALHTGEIDLRDERNYFGPSIIRCARLRSIAHGGQVLVSGGTRDLVIDRLPDGAELRDLGSYRLKDLGRPERVWQLCHADLVSEFPPLRSVDARPNNLPVQLTTFVGRETELVQLREVMDTSRLVTLTGAGGCGKTRLALQAAADVLDRYEDGVWCVELGPVSEADRVAGAVAEVLGLREEPGRPLAETLSEQLRARAVLVILDNCEQVLDGAAHLVETLLVAAPGLRVVATSREPLGIAGEVAWRVPSMDAQSASGLFVERAVRARPTFTPDTDAMAVVEQICQRLDGLPLAIELAAARTRMMHPNRISAALDDRFRLLTGGNRTVMPRQQTLEASVAWSHDLLDESEQALLRRLSTFAGGFTLEAAEVVGADGELVDGYGVLDLLARLVDKSLVQADGDASDRYRLLETIRHYTRERLVEAGEGDETRDRHLTYFLDLAERAEPELMGADGPEWLRRLEDEHENLRGALEWAEAAGHHQQFLRLVTALTLFWELRGHLASGGRWFTRALTGHDASSTERARALWGAAHVAVYGDDFETAAQRAPEALAMAEAVDDTWATARALNTVGYLQLWFEPSEARAALEQSVELGRSIGDNWAIADGLKMITVAWLMQDDYAGLRGALDDLLAVAEPLDNKFFIAWYHCGVGYTALHQGEIDAARRSLETSLQYCDEVGEPATAGIVDSLLGELETLTGDYEAAGSRLGAFLVRANATGGAIGAPFAVNALAALALGCDDPGLARDVIEPFVEEMRPLGLPLFLSWSLSLLGGAVAADGDLPGARTTIEEAKGLAEAIDNPRLGALARSLLGAIARHDGRTDVAEDLHHEALALRNRCGVRPAVIESLEALAGLAVDGESPAEAARIFAAADAARRAIGAVRAPAGERTVEQDMARVRSQLDAAAFDAAWAEGDALSLDDTIAYVSRARGERKRPSSGWSSLTPTEERVVALVAEGLTNPQIAERLFVARGTVKVHLGHIFTKLDVSTRAELAAAATRRSAEHSPA